MLNDFLTGKIANPRAEHIIPTIAELLARARANRPDWLVVYANDAHLPSDFELAVWGENAMAGTPGAEIIPALAAAPGDFRAAKRSYSSFYETSLDPLLRGYRLHVPEDTVEAISAEDQAAGLAYLCQMYSVETAPARVLLGA